MVEIHKDGYIVGGAAHRRLAQRHDRADGARTYLKHLEGKKAIEYPGTKVRVLRIPPTAKSKWWGVHGEMGIWRCKEFCESVVGELMTVKKFNRELARRISPDQVAIGFLETIPCNVEHIYQKEIAGGLRTGKCSECHGIGLTQARVAKG